MQAHGLRCSDASGVFFVVLPKPGKNPIKKPYITDGENRATTYRATIDRWGVKWPDAMPGIPTGPRSMFAVVDADCKNGKDGFAELRAMGFDPDTLSPVIVESPGGSRHLYFRYEEGLRPTTDKIASGVDVRAAGGYVAAHGADPCGRHFPPCVGQPDRPPACMACGPHAPFQTAKAGRAERTDGAALPCHSGCPEGHSKQ